MLNEQIEKLAKGGNGELLVKVLKDFIAQVADVRTKIDARAEIANDVRLGVIEVIERDLLHRLQVVRGEQKSQQITGIKT